MAKIKKTALFSTLISIILGVVFALGLITSRNETVTADRVADKTVVTLTSDDLVDIVVSADSPFALIYSTDAMQNDSALATDIRTLTRKTGKNFRPSPDTTKETEFEILLGNTNRQISQIMLQTVNTYGSPDELYVWGYGYRNGKLVYTANCQTAFELGKQEFLDLIDADGALRVPSDLWVVNYMSVEEYEQILRDEAEAEKQARIDALIAKNEEFKNEEKLKKVVNIIALVFLSIFIALMVLLIVANS